jgi:mannitol 2-dehydrogenase
VNELASGIDKATIVTSLTDYAPVFKDPMEMAKILDPKVKIVSLTVTEKGYTMDTNGDLDVNNEDVKKDIANISKPDFSPTTNPPNTAVGLIAVVLLDRMLKNPTLNPPTIMSCDNLPMNGNTTKKVVAQFVSLLNNASLTTYLTTKVAFPNSMVDRITPVTLPEHIKALETNHNILDNWPVVCEPFLQWVVEDTFTDGRPDFPSADGVIFTSSVEHYEFMKLRLLNSTHSSLSYISTLKAHKYVHEAMSDKDITAFVRSYMHEVKKTLHPVPGIDLDEYIETLIQRFSNPNIADTLDRLSMDGSGKFKATLLPPLREMKEKGWDVQGNADGISLALAGYVKYYGEVEETVPDPLKDELESAGKKMKGDMSKDNLGAFLEIVFGELRWEQLIDNVYMWYMVLEEKGAEETMVKFNESR